MPQADVHGWWLERRIPQYSLVISLNHRLINVPLPWCWRYNHSPSLMCTDVSPHCVSSRVFLPLEMIQSYISVPLHLLCPFHSPVRMRSAHTREYIPLSYIVNTAGEESRGGVEKRRRGRERWSPPMREAVRRDELWYVQTRDVRR